MSTPILVDWSPDDRFPFVYSQGKRSVVQVDILDMQLTHETPAAPLLNDKEHAILNADGTLQHL